MYSIDFISILYCFIERYEIERRQGEAKRRRQTEEERRKAKELEEQRRRRDLAKSQQSDDRMLYYSIYYNYLRSQIRLIHASINHLISKIFS